MEWSTPSFRVAAAQISSVREPCKTIEVVELPTLKTNEEEWEQEKDYFDIIDKALVSDIFPSLRYVILRDKRRWDYFPLLQSRNLIKATEY